MLQKTLLSNFKNKETIGMYAMSISLEELAFKIYKVLVQYNNNKQNDQI